MKTSRIDAAEASYQPAVGSGQRVASLQATIAGRADERGAALQRVIDQSPRVLAQRQALQAAFGGAIQRQASGLEDDEPLQTRMDPGAQRVGLEEDDELPPLQTRIEGTGDASVAEAIGAPHVNATGMPKQLKAGIEALSGMDMSAVRVHRNSDKPAQLNALAYAQGTDIYLGPGQEKHLPHEAWHVVQQAQGRVRPTMQMKDGIPVNADTALEAEADAMGARAFHVEGGRAGATLSPRLEPLGRSANGAALQARWMIRDGLRVDVADDYVLQPGESWADDAQALPASRGIASSSLGEPSSGMEAAHLPKHESKAEQADNDKPTSDSTVASPCTRSSMPKAWFCKRRASLRRIPNRWAARATASRSRRPTSRPSAGRRIWISSRRATATSRLSRMLPADTARSAAIATGCRASRPAPNLTEARTTYLAFGRRATATRRRLRRMASTVRPVAITAGRRSSRPVSNLTEARTTYLAFGRRATATRRRLRWMTGTVRPAAIATGCRASRLAPNLTEARTAYFAFGRRATATRCRFRWIAGTARPAANPTETRITWLTFGRRATATRRRFRWIAGTARPAAITAGRRSSRPVSNLTEARTT